jgi:hypothetical protein
MFNFVCDTKVMLIFHMINYEKFLSYISVITVYLGGARSGAVG